MATFETVEVKDASGNELKGCMVTQDLRIPSFGKPPEETANIIHNVANLPIRDDDVMFWSAPKSGTHWVFEIISMLVSGKAESTEPLRIDRSFLEFCPQSQVEACPSPRVLDSHLPFRLLPIQLKEKKTKIVALVRNPKDVCVSLYNQDRGIKWLEYNGKFEDYLQLFMAGQLWYGMWFDYILEMEEVMNSGEYNMHLIYYEDLKKNGLEEIQKLAKFLEVSVSNVFCQAVKAKCDFESMLKNKGQDEKEYFKPGFSMYRKGQVGDWKNYFTVAMSEEFDKWYKEGMKNSKLDFRFS